MRIQGRRIAALMAVFLLATGACSSKPSKNDEVALDNGAVRLTRPALKVAPNGAWALSASFAWEVCGERACFAFEKGRHGGPDVFGDAGRNVQVAAGRAGDNPKVDWGDDKRRVVTALPTGNGIYDCAGAPK